MKGVWEFLKDPNTVAILTSIAAILAIAGAVWRVSAFFAKKAKKGGASLSVTADHGGVAAGRDISGPVSTNACDAPKR